MLNPQQRRQYFAFGFEGNLFLLFVLYDFRHRGRVAAQELRNKNDLIRVRDRAHVFGIGQMLDGFQFRDTSLRPNQPEFFGALFIVKLYPVVVRRFAGRWNLDGSSGAECGRPTGRIGVREKHHIVGEMADLIGRPFVEHV